MNTQTDLTNSLPDSHPFFVKLVMLECWLAIQEQSSCERIQALQEDRVVFLEDANNHRDMLLARVQALQGQLTEAEDGVLELTNSLEAGRSLAS